MLSVVGVAVVYRIGVLCPVVDLVFAVVAGGGDCCCSWCLS